MLENIRKSLGLKSILWLCFVLVVILTAITTMNIKEQNKVLLDRGQDTANRLKESILTAMRHPMMVGDQEIIQLQFDEYKKLKDIVRINLINDTGIIRRSSDRSLLGQKSDSAHLKAGLEGKEFHAIETLKDTKDKVFTEIKPIFNEKQCYGCHGQDKKILGVLKIYLNWEPVLKTVNMTKNRNILLSLFGLLIIAIFNIIFLLKVIIFPIKKLESGMKEVSRGNLDQSITTDSKDEVGQLTQMFNKMTADLKRLMEKEKSLLAVEQQKKGELSHLNENLTQQITERKKAEDKLQIVNRQLTDIIEFLPDATFVIDNNKKVVAWNRAIEEMTGVKKQDIVGKGDYAYAMPFYGEPRPILVDLVFNFDPEIEKKYDFVKKIGGNFYTEVFVHLIYAGKGGYLWATASPLFDNEGNVIGAIESIRDITERKKIEEALRETKGYLENLFSCANAPIIVWGSDFVISRFNRAFEELTGIKAEETIGKRLEILFPEQSCETSMAMISKTLSGERWEVVELPILHKSGEVRTVLWNSANVFGQDGTTIIATIAQGTDITERKKMEEELKSIKQRIEFILSTTKTGLDIIDKNFDLVYVDPGWAKLYGDYKGKKCYEYFADKDCMCPGCAIPRAFETKEIIVSEEVLPKEGNRPIQVVTLPFKNEKGEWLVAEVNVDITERKKIEEKIKNYSIELEKSNRELDDFTFIISHDLKEPLRSIDAFSGFVLDDYKDKLDEEGKNYLERIRVNANRMQELIEDLLDISRIERKQNPFEEIETGELVNEIKLRLEYAIKEKNLELIVSDNLPKIFCDRVRLTEVFANLVSNAIKFNDKPKPVIEIGCSKKDCFYEFYVKDNGPGIDERYFEKIFEIFQRLGHRETTEGTGVGLTIAKKIVQMHKGKIWVESKVGEGTTFYFTIPIKAELIQGTVTKESLFTKEEVQKVIDKG